MELKATRFDVDDHVATVTLAAPTAPAQRVDRPDARRVPMDHGAVGGRPIRAGRRCDRAATGVLRRRRQRRTRGPRRARLIRHGTPARSGRSRIRRPARVRRRLRLAVRLSHPHHCRRERSGGRHRIGAGPLLRPSIRQRVGQDHDRSAQARPARRVRDELGAPPSRRGHPGGRSPPFGPHRHRRRHGRVGSLERGPGRWRIGARRGARVRTPPRDHRRVRTPSRRPNVSSTATSTATTRRHRLATRSGCSTRRCARPSTAKGSPHSATDDRRASTSRIAPCGGRQRRGARRHRPHQFGGRSTGAIRIR